MRLQEKKLELKYREQREIARAKEQKRLEKEEQQELKQEKDMIYFMTGTMLIKVNQKQNQTILVILIVKKVKQGFRISNLMTQYWKNGF